MTPIVEMEISSVTRAEAAAYERWRDTYQENWRDVLDPIAIRLTARADLLGVDLTVMPLIGGSDYRQYVELAGKARIRPGAGDPHNALLHITHAIDRASRPMRELGEM